MIPAVETKSMSDDVASAFEDFARAFEAFKDTNDTRLSELETRLSGDVVTDEKLTRIDAALDDAKRRLDRLALDRSRPPLAGQETSRDPRRPSTRAPFTPISGPARRRA
jgi:predicted phage gp36 major capsid-like protein